MKMILLLQTHKTTFDVSLSNNLDEKLSLFKLDAKAKLGICSGLIKVEGSVSFLNKSNETHQLARAMCNFQMQDRFEELPPELIQNPNMIPEKFENHRGTHVVVGIQYGANAFFEFEKKIDDKKNKQDVAGSIKGKVEKIPTVTIGKSNF